MLVAIDGQREVKVRRLKRPDSRAVIGGGRHYVNARTAGCEQDLRSMNKGF
jgi:hypothetical protein